jgi:hypothetical protein
MKKISFMLCAAALMLASTFTSCTNEDNSIYENNVVIRNGYYLNDIIADAIEKSTGNEIVVNLPDTIALRTKADVAIEIPEGKNISIIGKVGAPARVQLKSGFITNGNVTLKNIDIDAKGLNTSLINFNSEEPVSSVITLDNLKFKNLEENIINWWWLSKEASVSIDNSEFALNGLWTNAAVSIKNCKIDLNGGGIYLNKNFTVEDCEIDAQDVYVPFWYNTTGLELNDANCYIVEDPVIFKGIKVKNMKDAFFYDDWNNIIFKQIIVDNCEIEAAANWNVGAMFYLGSGGALNFTIQNSKVYTKEGTIGGFDTFTYYNWEKIPANAGLPEGTEWSFVYKNNTFENIINNYWHEGGNYDKVDLLSIDIENNTWTNCQKNVDDIDIIKTLRRWHEAEDLKSVVVKNNKITKTTTYDFAAAAEADENPANFNGNQNNGQGFYGWEKADKTDSRRNDYKGYTWADGSVLPQTCHVWRRGDRINNNIVEGGLNCPNDKEMAVDGLFEGSKVMIYYDAEKAKEDAKELIWAIGDGTSADPKLDGPRTVAVINGVEAVPGETPIPSGATIEVKSVTPAVNGTGYIVFKVKKNMVVSKVVIVNQREN